MRIVGSRTARRAAAALAGAVLGLGVAAAPAAATPGGDTQDRVAVAGTAQCDAATGEWQVTWTITNDGEQRAEVRDLDAEPGAVPGLDEGLDLPGREAGGEPGRAVFTQAVPAGRDRASLSFTATWPGGQDPGNVSGVDLPGGECLPSTDCVKAEDARFRHTFDVEGTRARATVTLDDGVSICHEEPVSLVSYFAPRPEFATPQYAFDQVTQTISRTNRSVTLEVDVPACNTQVDLIFGGADEVITELTGDGPRYGDRKIGSDSGPGSRSEGPQGWYNGGTAKCQQPEVAPVSTCGGALDVKLSNTGDISRYAVDFTVTAGDFTRTVTVQPGKGRTVRVPAGKGPATVTATGMPTRTLTWTQPRDCAAPAVGVDHACDTGVTVTVTNRQGGHPTTARVSYGAAHRTVTVGPRTTEKVTFKHAEADTVTVAFPGRAPVTKKLDERECAAAGAAGGTAGLPVTGAAAGLLAGGAAVLVAVGVVLYLVARRRKVRFTA